MNDRAPNGIHRLGGLAVAVDRRAVARLLGYPPRPLPRRVRDVVAGAEKSAPVLVRPVGLYRLLDRAHHADSAFLGGVDRVAIAVVSIGGALERAVAEYRAQGLMGSALILDAFGSAAAESAAESAEAAIRAAVATEGARCSRRFSPGYGDWDVREQRWILDALGAHEIGIALTEGSMMTPRKSVTFAMTVGENPVELRGEDICSTCGAVDCRWRDTPEKCPGRQQP